MARLPDPSRIDDSEKLRNLMANAKRLGHDELALACQIRIAELAGAEFDDDLEREFWIAVKMAEEFKTEENGRTTRLTRTRQKHARDGSKKCIEDLASRPDVTEGFRILAENGRPDLTFEAVLLRHADKFDSSTVNSVRKKLLDYGLTETTLEKWIHGQG